MNFHKHYDNGLDERYRVQAYRIGASTSVQTPDQLAELGNRLNEGMQNVEVGTVGQDVFEQIPNQHFEEIRRLAKLSNAKLSMHAPIQDLAGFDQRGKWTEQDRQENERYFKSVIDRAYKLSPDGNIPVTMHSTAGVPAMYPEKGIKDEKGNELGYSKLIAIDQESGQLAPLEYEKKHYIGGDKTYTPKNRMENYNQTKWDQEKLELFSYLKNKDDLKARFHQAQAKADSLRYKNEGQGKDPHKDPEFISSIREINLLTNHIHELDTHIVSGANEIYNKFKKYSKYEDQPDKRVLDSIEIIGKRVNEEKALSKEMSIINKQIEIGKMSLGEGDKRKKIIVEKIRSLSTTPEDFLNAVSGLPAPKILVPVEEFALSKSSETISNIAEHAYKKYKENAPVVSIENVYPELAFSRADSLKKLVTTSRDQLVEKLVKNQKLDKNKAKKVAEKIIGATWDLGHINQLRKYGYTEEELLSEHRKMMDKGLIKHIHLADNFGFTDSHLPPGMGNVPNKKVLQELDHEADFKGKIVVEAGAFAAGFKTSPFPYSIEGLDSPIYKYDMSPIWEQNAYSHYSVGYGDTLPDLHFRQLYGSGFSNLPRELGGEISGRSRFAGTPNQ